MKSKRSSQIAFAILVATTLACSLGVPAIPKVQTGATQTLSLNASLPNPVTVMNVDMTMGIGELNLSGGAETLLQGNVRYNVEEWKPTVTNTRNSLTVTQGEADDAIRGFPGEDVINVWNVRLGNIPMNLSLRAGGYDASLDLTGLPLRQLDIQDGASESEIRFDSLNPEDMQTLTYSTGASTVTFLGLANANFPQMTFEGGAGEYTFDFSGALQRDAAANIKAGLSTVRIVVPQDISARVVVDGAVGSISVNDQWEQQGKQYVNEGNSAQLLIWVELGAGSLYLSNE
jgi:hypothetical protein